MTKKSLWLTIACGVGLVVGVVGESPARAGPGGSPSPARGTGRAGITPAVTGLAPLPGGVRAPLHLRPPGAREDDGGPSLAVFPPQTIALRFNHGKHVKDLGMPCTACHDRATKSTKSSDSLLPPGTRCDACHGTDHRDLVGVTGDDGELLAQCGFCHTGYEPADGTRVRRTVVPSPNLHFDHAAHAARNIGCAQCHGAVGELELATRDQLPRMHRCFDCHQAPEASRGEAKGDCATCHLLRKDGVLRQSFPSGTLHPPRWLHDAAHDADWIERHKSVAGADSGFCSSCHREEECVACHDGRVRPRRVHPNDYLSMHAAAARQNNPRCTSCHQVQSFCTSCHQRVGIALSSPLDATADRGRFHPPASEWTDPPRSAKHHAWEAQRNIEACVSCHVERDCVVCHATATAGGLGVGPGPGRGVNPHPPGFRRECSRALRKNARPCLVCHAPEDPKLTECL